MSQYVQVFSEDGEPFEVLAHMAGDLVLNKGFTQTKPEAVVVDSVAVPVADDEEDYEEEEDEHTA